MCMSNEFSHILFVRIILLGTLPPALPQLRYLTANINNFKMDKTWVLKYEAISP